MLKTQERIGGAGIFRGGLTSRESRIVDEISRGSTNKEIATTLGIGEDTVKVYCSNLYKKTGMTRWTMIKIPLRDHERKQAIRLNEWIQKWSDALPAESLPQIKAILSEQVANVLI